MVSNAAPPGWYPDPWKQAAQRFWDGAQWTHRLAGGSARVQRPQLPEGAPVYGPIIWILALLPFLGGIGIWFVHPDAGPLIDYIRQTEQAAEAGQTSANVGFSPFSIYGGTAWVASLISWGSIAVSIVLAYFDWRRLGRIGVVRPFNWAWAFLAIVVSIGVYVIGRSVIVHRVSARGLAPIWVFIAAYVATFVSAAIWAISWIGPFIDQVTNNLPTT